MKYLAAIVSILALVSSNAWSQHKHGDEHKAKYGGVVKEVNEIQHELVAKPGVVTVYVEDHGKKVPTTGMSGKVTLRQGSERSEVALSPTGDNKLEGKGTFKIGPGTLAILQVKRPGKAEESVRFPLK
jgi:hypothetical protein